MQCVVGFTWANIYLKGLIHSWNEYGDICAPFLLCDDPASQNNMIVNWNSTAVQLQVYWTYSVCCFRGRRLRCTNTKPTYLIVSFWRLLLHSQSPRSDVNCLRDWSSSFFKSQFSRISLSKVCREIVFPLNCNYIVLCDDLLCKAPHLESISLLHQYCVVWWPYNI